MKYLRPIFIIFGLLVLFAPLITHNSVYNNIVLGGDTQKVFIPLIEKATNGVSLIDLVHGEYYLGLNVAMWALGVANRFLHITPDLLFYLYSMLVLVGASVTLYYFGKVVGGERTGWLTLLMVLFCNTTLVALITVGCTVNIINVYIILLWAIILFAKWYSQHKWYWLVISLALMGIFSVLHPTGAYLPATLAVIVFSVNVWLLSTKKPDWRLISLTVLILTGSFILARYGGSLINSEGVPITAFIESNTVGQPSTYLKDIGVFLVPAPTAVALFTTYAWWKAHKAIAFDKIAKVVLVILLCLFTVLIMASALRITTLYVRQIIDASSVLSIIVAIVLGRLLKENKWVWLKNGTYSFILIGSLIAVRFWIW